MQTQIKTIKHNTCGNPKQENALTLQRRPVYNLTVYKTLATFVCMKSKELKSESHSTTATLQGGTVTEIGLMFVKYTSSVSNLTHIALVSLLCTGNLICLTTEP